MLLVFKMGKFYSKLTTLGCIFSRISAFDFSTVVKQAEPAAFLQCVAFRRIFSEDLLTHVFKVRLCAQIKTLNIMEGKCGSKSAVGSYLGVPYRFDGLWGNPTF